MTAVAYRREVDGLRAIAVVPVVLFHAQLGFAGGFVGVDVFFVISGYLITSLILKDGVTFSLASFWERRVRRILPAAWVMLLACLVAGWLLLVPRDFLNFGRSLVAQPLLLANVLFWRDLNYFNTEAVRPLLHTWSLAVEEQFYLFLPPILFVFRTASRQAIGMCIALVALASFVANVVMLRAYPTPTFYLLPTRAWELLIGSLIAALPRPRIAKRWVAEALSAAGLLTIVGAATLYQASAPFPGLAALPPCLGAAAIIIATETKPTWVGRFLSLRLLVWIGTVSYSLYLWHWPILTFARYGLHRVSVVGNILLVLFTFAIAWASWKFIEQPTRRRRVLTERTALFVAAGLAMTATIASGVVIVRAAGFPSRWGTDALHYIAEAGEGDFRVDLDLSTVRSGKLTVLNANATGPIELLVWGDSHAMAILPAVSLVCREHGVRCLSATHTGTAPLLDFAVGPLGEDALPYSRSVTEFVRRHQVKRVLLAAAWASQANGREARFRLSMSETVRVLQEAGAAVVILKDVPMPMFDVPVALAVAVEAGQNVRRIGIRVAEHRASNSVANGVIDSMASGAMTSVDTLGPLGESILVLDPTESFSEGTDWCRVERGGHPLYYDFHHISTQGAMLLVPLFEQVLNARITDEHSRGDSPRLSR